MSFFTWIGASVGCILAHFNVISFDFLHIKAESQSTQFNLLKSLSQDAIRIPLNIFMCTLSGALLGLLSHMTWDVSFPSLVVFSASSIVTSKYCTRLFSLPAIGCTQEQQQQQKKENEIVEESNEEEVEDQRQEEVEDKQEQKDKEKETEEEQELSGEEVEEEKVEREVLENEQEVLTRTSGIVRRKRRS